MKALLQICAFLCMIGSALAQSTISTSVVYVRTGDVDNDDGSIASLMGTVAALQQSGRNVNGVNYTYTLRVVDTVAQAVAWADSPPAGVNRVMFVGHGTRNPSTGEFYHTVKDTTNNATPFSEIDYKFWFFFACGLDNRTLSNEDFGAGAAAANGHQYKKNTTSSEGGARGVSSSWTASGAGNWTTVQFFVQYTIITQMGTSFTMEVIGSYVTLPVWVPTDIGGGNQNISFQRSERFIPSGFCGVRLPSDWIHGVPSSTG